MKNLIDRLIARNNSSLLILSKSLYVQIIMWCIMFATAIIFIGHKTLPMFMYIWILIVYLIPLLSIVAIFISIIQIVKKNTSKLPILGLVLNFLWFIIYLIVLYLVFVVKISV